MVWRSVGDGVLNKKVTWPGSVRYNLGALVCGSFFCTRKGKRRRCVSRCYQLGEGSS
jgi:hypothetical protein